MHLIDELEKELGKSRLPAVHPGDTVEVDYLIREGDKERVQVFRGTVIRIRGRGIRRTITVRRIVQGEGVERVFPLHGPRIQDVRIVRRGDVRRAKLYYLRERVGKKTRVRELLGEKVRRQQAEEAAARQAELDRAAKAAESEAASEAASEEEPSEAVEV